MKHNQFYRILHDEQKGSRDIGRKVLEIKNYYGLNNDIEIIRMAVHKLWIYVNKLKAKDEENETQ